MTDIKTYVEKMGGLYIDISSMYEVVPIHHEMSVREKYTVALFEQLAKTWKGNTALEAAITDELNRIQNHTATKEIPDAMSFDQYGWNLHIDRDLPKAATQTDKYDISSTDMIAAAIMSKFYDSDSSILCIAIESRKYDSIYRVLDRISYWLSDGIRCYGSTTYIRWNVETPGMTYVVYLTTAAEASTFIENMSEISEVTMDNYDDASLPVAVAQKVFSGSDITRIGLDVFKLMGITAPDIDNTSLGLSYRQDFLPVGAAGTKDCLAIPTKTKLTPFAFANAVFERYGYIMDLSAISTNARFPKLSKVTKNVRAWAGTGRERRAAVESIIDHCMEYGNTITVKQETSGIKRTTADPKEPDSDED